MYIIIDSRKGWHKKNWKKLISDEIFIWIRYYQKFSRDNLVLV